MVIENKFALHEQEHGFSCGPATLKMLYEKSGIFMSEDDIINDMGSNENGYGWVDIQGHVQEQGLTSQLFRNASWEDLLKHQDKSIMVCYFTTRTQDPGFHFSLLQQIDDEMISLADPSFGDVYTYDREKFTQHWHDEEGKGNFLAVWDYAITL